MTDQDLRRRLELLEDEVRYLRRRLDDAIARPPVPVVIPVAPSPSVPREAPLWVRGPTCGKVEPWQ